MLNLIVILKNAISNGSIIHTLIKAKQLSNLASKLICMLIISDLIIDAFAQTLFFTLTNGANCLIQNSLELCHFLSKTYLLTLFPEWV